MMLFLLFAVTCLGAFVFMQQIRLPYERPSFVSKPGIPPFESYRHLQPAKNERFIYPYSVIPGGVLSREELAKSISSDKVVAEHYANFEVDKAKIVKSEETQFMYVSYRVRNKVFWTAKKIRIPQGESLITDGRICARTRCGNRVSVVPEEPISEDEPVVEAFEIPVLSKVQPSETGTPPETADWLLAPYTPVVNSQILPNNYRPLFTVQPTDVVVPEPATLNLLTIGLLSFFAIRSAQKD